MKKFLFAFILSLSLPVFAGCTGGTEVSGQYGRYCISKITMNWWTAHAWCQGNNLPLATLEQVYGEGTPHKAWGTGSCSFEFGNSKSRAGWLATPSGTGQAFYARSQDSAIVDSRNSLNRAICYMGE